jgi:hypothetical protein
MMLLSLEFGEDNMPALNTISQLFDTDRTQCRIDCDHVLKYTPPSSYIDNTSPASSWTSSDTFSFPNISGGALYFGCNTGQFNSLGVYESINGEGGVISWKYWNGSIWNTFTPISGYNNSNFNDGKCFVYWDPDSLIGWTQTTVNGLNSLWIKAELTTIYTTVPYIHAISMGRVKTFSTTITQSDIPLTWDSVWLERSNYISAHTSNEEQVVIYLKIENGPNILAYKRTPAQSSSPYGYTHRKISDITTAWTANIGSASSTNISIKVSSLYKPDISSRNSISNMSIKLMRTYTYDENTNTRCKTIRIPLFGSTTSTLTTFSEIPILDDFCPEANKIFRNIMMEYEGANSCDGNAEPYTLYSSIDSSPISAYATCINDGGSSTHHTFFQNLNNISTNSTHTVSISSSTSANQFPNLHGMLWVTYDYDEDASTQILNSVVLPISYTSLFIGGVLSANAERYSIPFWIQEPSTLTMKNSGVLFVTDGTITTPQNLNIRVTGDTSYTPYTTEYRENVMGQISILHPISTTLQNGKNIFTVELYNSSQQNQFRGHWFVLYLNYISNKSNGGSWKHNHTVEKLLFDQSVAGSTTGTITKAAALTTLEQGGYFLQDVYMKCLDQGVATHTTNLYAFISDDGSQHQRQGGYLEHSGWIKQNANEYTQVSTISIVDWFNKVNDGIKACSNTVGRLKPVALNGYGVIVDDNSLKAATISCTYHCNTFPISGNFYSHSVNGSPPDIFLISLDPQDGINIGKVVEAETNGTWSTTWHDNALDIVAYTHYDNKNYGISRRGKAGT